MTLVLEDEVVDLPTHPAQVLDERAQQAGGGRVGGHGSARARSETFYF
jgi:hypothetical protein